MDYQVHKKKIKELALGYIEKLGGVANIEQIEACSTRLRIMLNEKIDIKLEMLRELGAKGILEKSKKEIHIVIGVEAEEIVEQIEELR